MKSFKCVAFASVVFDVYLQTSDFIKETQYPVFEKGAEMHQELFLLEQWLKCNY